MATTPSSSSSGPDKSRSEDVVWVDRFMTRWAVGRKQPMQQRAARLSAVCEMTYVNVSRRDPSRTARWFGCYPTWDAAWGALNSVAVVGDRRFNEIIRHGRPCKPYLDIDGAALPPGCASLEELARKIENAVIKVFKDDYGVELPNTACYWTHSPRKAKVSLHLTVSTHSPQYVYRCNHQDDEHGAAQLAMRVRQLLMPADADVAGMVDAAVYTADREMRLVYSTKVTDPESPLVPFYPHGPSCGPALGETVCAETAAVRDYVVTWLDDAAKCQTLVVPLYIPRTVRAAKSGYATPKDARGQALATHQREHAMHNDCFVRGRMLELLQKTVHPTAYVDKTHGAEDPYDPRLGAKFNYTDRAEPCYTGKIHDGEQNMRCWVHNEDVFVKCFSDRCQDHGARRLGPLYADSDQWASRAIRVDLQYLDPTDADLRAVLDAWQAGEFLGLCLRSGMGTGKTTLLRWLLDTMFPQQSVLIVTYRQTLAHEFSRKLEEFSNYLDFIGNTGASDLSDRELHPRVICQLESLHRLGAWETPRFDLVILDEVESVLMHASSPTLKTPIATVHYLRDIVRGAGRVMAMDAYLASAACTFLDKCNVPHRVVINERHPPQRTYVFSEDVDAWIARIMEDLRAGRNVVVASMTTEMIEKAKRTAISLGILKDPQVLRHTSKTCDTFKIKVKDVDKLWVKYNLVLFSPTIEAGVDFSTRHFYAMYVFCSRMSTTPLGLVQMTGRVRTLQNMTVHACAPRGMLATPKFRHVTVDETRAGLRWLQHSSLKLHAKMQNVTTTKCYDADTGRMAFMRLPPDDAMFEILAHNEAAKANSELRFFAELRDLLTQSGHVVRVAGADPADDYDTGETAEQGTLGSGAEASSSGAATLTEGGDTAEGDSATSGQELSHIVKCLLEARDLTTELQYREVRADVLNGRASEAVKYIHARHLVKQFYAVDRLDAAFLLEGRTNPYKPQVMVLVRMLYPTLYRPKEGDGHYDREVLMAHHVLEVLTAMGFAGPFDTEHSFQEDLVDVHRTKLQDTAMFKEYPRCARLFSASATIYTTWDSRAVGKALQMVLNAVGLSLKKQRSRGRDASGKRVKAGPTAYWLDPDDVQTMAELLKLKVRRSGNVMAVNAHAQQYLAGLQITKYRRLVDEPPAAGDWRGGNGRG